MAEGITMARVHELSCAAVIAFYMAMSCSARADELSDRLQFWQANPNALLCDANGPGEVAFPSKQTGEKEQPCNDGDMTLFNGLLCAAGDKHGCEGVAEAQDPTTGQWYRSPRIRIHGNDRGGADFSPDMALGAELYLIATKDVVRARRWLLWLDKEVPCSISLFGKCAVQGAPRFCAPEAGCTMRPGDIAALSATVNFLQRTAGLESLPDGRLRGALGTFSGFGPALSDLDSQFNKPGFSQHLTGVTILLLRMAGSNDARLDNAAARLVDKNPGNAFFSFLKEGKTDHVKTEVLNRCPDAHGGSLVMPLNEWQWERPNSDKAWEHSCYWDCIFMAELLR